MVFPIAGGTQSTGYDIENSIRFEDGDSPYLSRTPSSAGNRRTFTISVWAKRSDSNQSAVLYGAGSAATDMFQIIMQNDGGNNSIIVQNRVSGTNNLNLVTNANFTDTSAWYHIVLAVDTTQGTASNRAKLYVNGDQVSSFSTETYPSQNYDCHVNNTVAHHIGAQSRGSANDHFDGYIAELNSVDGTALTPTSFGKTNSENIWIPIKPTVSSYGTNGFFMEFQNQSTYTVPTARHSSDGNTVVLINSGAADGNTSFTDSSSNGISITADGNVHHESDVAKFSTSSIYFDGNGDSLTLADNSAYDFGSNDFTIEMWIYPTDLNDYDGLVAFGSGTSQMTMWLRQDGNIRFANIQGSGTDIDSTFGNTFMVENEWNHIAVTRTSNTLRAFINGVVTAETYTHNLSVSVSGLKIGVEPDNNRYFTGYMDSIRISDNVRYTPSADSANYGTDTSGNGNHFTPNNITPHQLCTDTPTNNFSTMSNLYSDRQQGGAITFAEGNTMITTSYVDANYQRYPTAYSSMAVSSGKWYFEMRPDSGSDFNIGVFSPEDFASDSTTNPYGGYAATGCIYTEVGAVRQNDNQTTGLGSYGIGDIVGCALDMDNNAVYFHKNGTYINSGNPTSGSDKTGAFTLPTTGENGLPVTLYGFTMGEEGAGGTGTMRGNFGNPAFGIASSNADAEGHGSFEYAVPSGYFALCSKNLAEYG